MFWLVAVVRGVGGVGGEWVGAWKQGLEEWGPCYVCVSCETGFFVYMAGLDISISRRVHAHLRCTQCFNHVAPYRCLISYCVFVLRQIYRISRRVLCAVVGPG